MEIMDEKNKKLLTQSKDRISFLYLDKCRVEQTDYSVQIIRGQETVEIPITTISCLFLGPGTSITHRAIATIAKAGCSVCWVGEEINVFYAYGNPATYSSKRVLLQCKYHENKTLHLKVVRNMYKIRYPYGHLKSKSVEELRGVEGKYMKEAYKSSAEKYGVNWEGRRYKPEEFNEQDTVNQYLTALNHVLYAVVESVIVALGYSPAIGFIHTGHMQAFVFDIADLYKEKIVIPVAFELTSIYGIYRRDLMLSAFRKAVVEEKLMKQIVYDINSLFEQTEGNSIEVELNLWGIKNFGISGKNYSET